MAENPDIVGFSTMCHQYHTTIRIARACKDANPDLKIVLGGPHATITDMETIEAFPFVDLIVRGECEQNIAQIFKAIHNKDAL